jgi:hypothetical protein
MIKQHIDNKVNSSDRDNTIFNDNTKRVDRKRNKHYFYTSSNTSKKTPRRNKPSYNFLKRSLRVPFREQQQRDRKTQQSLQPCPRTKQTSTPIHRQIKQTCPTRTSNL